MRALLLAFVLSAFSLPALAAVIQPGQILPVQFFCVKAEPLLDMLALDAKGDLAAAELRFAEAQASGVCHILPGPISGKAIAFMGGAVTTSSGLVEVWAIELPGAPGPVYAGFKSDLIRPPGDPA